MKVGEVVEPPDEPELGATDDEELEEPEEPEFDDDEEPDELLVLVPVVDPPFLS